MLNKFARARAFSRIELSVLLGTVLFLFLYALPALCRTSARSERAICVNNLRAIGGAFLHWSSENGERNPWQHPPSDVGTKTPPQLAWAQFYYISNHLGSPKFLADPADRREPDQPTLNAATTWLNAPGGFIHPAHRTYALSYSLGIYATPLQPNSILSSDRNIRTSGTYLDGLFSYTHIVEPLNAAWTSSIHAHAGNLLFNDGRVEQTDTVRLKEAVGWNSNWNRGFQFPFVE